jgi:two-component system phosphate regulon sensor histidine kinase PhoR
MKKKRLVWQIFSPYLIIILISMVAVGGYASYSLRRSFMKQIAADLTAQGHLVEKQMAYYLAPENEKFINDLCKEMGQASLTRITVILPTGRVIGDSFQHPEKMENHRDRPEVARALLGNIGVSTRYSHTLQDDMMYVAIPLIRHGQMAAIIRTAIAISKVDRDLRAILFRMTAGWFLVALLAAGVSLIVSRRISMPIEALKRAAALIAGGDLKHRLPSAETEEIDALSAAMNQMVLQLEDRINMGIRQRKELEAVLSSMVEGVVAVNMEEKVIRMNRAASGIFGGAQDRWKGSSIQELTRNRALHHFIQDALKNDETLEKDIAMYHPDERVLNIRGTPLRAAGDVRIGTLLVLNDVTHVRRLENMRKDFAANVSHEIKTPLTAIKGFVETLRHGAVKDPKESDRFLGIIEKHVNRLAAIIEDLMKLSRIEQDGENRQIRLEKDMIAEVLQSAVQICRDRAQQKNIRIEVTCDENLTVRMDRPLLEQAAVNLLDNAVQYSGENSPIRIEAEEKDNAIAILFKDHGIGIAEEHLPRLFERFYRVDKARSRKQGGTGLGLAIVKHIVHAHDGRVTVESTPGKGSTFTILLPKN